MSRHHTRLAGLTALALLASGCSQGSSNNSESSSPEGTIANLPGGGAFNKFVVESHKGGDAAALHVKSVLWGRLVDVFDCDQCGTANESRQPLFHDFLIDQDLQSDGNDFELVTNPVTQREELTILHPFGSAAFKSAFHQVTVGLQPVKPRSFDPFESDFTAVPRNAAMVLVFDDLLRADKITRENVQVFVGYPPESSFEARVVPDGTHGDIKGGVFYTTRVLVDFTISELESGQFGLNQNPIGLPSAVNTSQANVGLRIPTLINGSAGQFERLENLVGHGLVFDGTNAPLDSTSVTLDVVRTFRSRGKTSVTQDPYNGFLLDETPPRILSSIVGTVTNVVPPVSGDVYTIDYLFSEPSCAIVPSVGDVIAFKQFVTNKFTVLEVLGPGAGLSGGTAQSVPVRRIDDLNPNLPPFNGGIGDFRTPYSTTGGLNPACFLAFSPAPSGSPNANVHPAAAVKLAFSEAMDPELVDGFENYRLRDPVATGLASTVVSVKSASKDLASFTLTPALPLNHTNGQAESFAVDVRSGVDINTLQPFGLTDLAGNPIQTVDLLPSVSFTLLATAPTQVTGSRSLTFNSVDEDGDGGPEVRGQFVYNLNRGVIQARDVTRFDQWMDTTNQTSPVVQNMFFIGPPTFTPPGVVEPLSRFGSRTQAVWRYFDLSLPFYDDFSINLDIERMYWMAATAGVQLDNFPEFQLSVAHSRFLPDEFVDPMLGLLYPTSGLTPVFADNYLDDVEDPPTVLSPANKGYLINPLDIVEPAGHTGIKMIPFPVNLNIPVDQYKYWTWRDTKTQAVGGPNGAGVDARVNPPTAQDGYYSAGNVPTIGLPILMDFRTYPAPTQAGGINRMAAAAVNYPGNPAPIFRAHSTGGILSDNTTQSLIDPDQQTTALGGLDGNGNPTAGVDVGFYYGGVSFVTRVNRVHTRWFDTGAPLTQNLVQFAEVVTQPDLGTPIPGTSMSVAFRGATGLSNATFAANANNLDPYGNGSPAVPTTLSITFLNLDNTWKPQLSALAGARYIQARFTLVSNAESGVAPELGAFGFSFAKQ